MHYRTNPPGIRKTLNRNPDYASLTSSTWEAIREDGRSFWIMWHSIIPHPKNAIGEWVCSVEPPTAKVGAATVHGEIGRFGILYDAKIAITKYEGE